MDKEQQELLESIRNSDNGDREKRNGARLSEGHTSLAIDQISGTHSSDERYAGRSEDVERGTNEFNQGSTSGERAGNGYSEGRGPSLTENEHPSESDDRDDQRYEEYLSTPLPLPENEHKSNALRKKQLNADRQKRFRDRQQENTPLNQAQNRGVSVTSSITQEEHPKFSIKNILSAGTTKSNDHNAKVKEEVKLLTKTEVDALLENMVFIYMNGSGLLDNILEIIVKDHEAVSIWQLDEQEATMLARMHLERGRVDKQAAQSARVLLQLYDKIWLIMLAAPRVMGTVKHVSSHEGVSFK